MRRPFVIVGFLAFWIAFVFGGFALPLLIASDVSALGYSFVLGMTGALFGPLMLSRSFVLV